MNLAEALRLPNCPSVAFIGAGGKTTAMFQLARQLPPPVYLTTTTHLATDQLALADAHFSLNNLGDLTAIQDNLHPGVNLFVGAEAGENRWGRVDRYTLGKLWALANENQVPLLIEADGSRQLPVKAPADHEPSIPTPPMGVNEPNELDMAVVLVGLSALGQPLGPEWVHRPKRFSALSGLPLGREITPQALAQVLKHPDGGLKNIPMSVRRVVLANQADTPELQSQGQTLARLLIQYYQAVVIAALKPSGGQAKEQGRDPGTARVSKPSVYAVYEPVAAIILAAGESRRFGKAKQLLPWRGKALVHHVASIALSAGLSPVVVVTGAYGTRVQETLHDLDLIIVHNPEWQAGQSSSVRVGITTLPPESGGAVFLLADQPLVQAELVRRLVEYHSLHLAPVVAPLVDGRRANPVLFDKVTFPRLVELQGDVGGRALFSRYAPHWIEWLDSEQQLDIDTPEDYQRLIEKFP